MSNNFKRRQFVLTMTGTFLALLGSFTKKGFAQTTNPRITVQSKTKDLQKTLSSQIAATSSRRIDVNEAVKRSQQLNATADQIDEALDAFENRFVRLKISTTNPPKKGETSAVNQDSNANAVPPSLVVNTEVSLSSQEKQVANNLVTAYQTKIDTGELTAAQLRQDEQTLVIPVQTKQVCSNGRVCWKYKWWGIRIRLNHCGVEWVSNGGRVAAAGLPAPVAAAIIFFAAVLKLFDKGCGVQIHWLWFNVSWIKPKSCSKCN